MKNFKVNFNAPTPAFLLFAFLCVSQFVFAHNSLNHGRVFDNNCPTAKFSILNNGLDAGIPFQFANHSTGATSYLWDFGDGGTSMAVSPSHTFATPGTYTIRLYAFVDGCSAEIIIIEDAIVN